MCVIVQQSHQNLFRRVCSTNQSSVNQTVFSNHIITASQVPSQGSPGGSAGKEPTCNVRDLGLIPVLGGSLEKGMAIQSSILPWRIPMNKGAWWATVHGVARDGHNQAAKHSTQHTYTYAHIFFIYSCVDRHLDCLLVYCK